MSLISNANNRKGITLSIERIKFQCDDDLSFSPFLWVKLQADFGICLDFLTNHSVSIYKIYVISLWQSRSLEECVSKHSIIVKSIIILCIQCQFLFWESFLSFYWSQRALNIEHSPARWTKSHIDSIHSLDNTQYT